MTEEVTTLDSNDLTLRLSGTREPSGEIALDALSRIAASLQELATRVGRFVVGQHGPGRTLHAAAKVVDLRLTGLADGSTVLSISFGEHDVLPLDVGAESDIADRFWEIVAGVESGSRPDWVNPPIAESVLKLVDALTGEARSVEIRRHDGRRAVCNRDVVSREPWQMPRTTGSAEVVTVTGRLGRPPRPAVPHP